MADAPSRSRRTRAWRAAVLLSLAGAVGCANRDFSQWKPYSPEGAKFTVTMPGIPVKEHQRATNPRGNLETDIYTLDVPGGGFYTVTDAVMPPGLDLTSGLDEILDSSADRIVESASGRLLYKRNVSVAGYAGREVEVEIPSAAVEGGGRLRARVVLVGERLYELIAVTPDRRSADAEREYFLDSFTIRK